MHWFRWMVIPGMFFGAYAASAVELSPGPAAAPRGAAATVPLTFTDTSDAPTIVVLEFTFDPAVCTPLGGAVSGPGGLVFDWNVAGTTLYAIVYSLGGAISAQDELELYLDIAIGAPLGAFQVARTGGSASNADAGELDIVLGGFSVTVTENTATHSADINGDWTITLSEVLRIIQFYNSGGLQCGVGTEDGFAPGQGDTGCTPHDSDYAPQDWDMNLSEILRIIQFYNLLSGNYHPDAGGEDGFAPGAF